MTTRDLDTRAARMFGGHGGGSMFQATDSATGTGVPSQSGHLPQDEEDMGQARLDAIAERMYR
ncbi:MAG: hypothetical protein ACTJGE_02925 [Corynebacterium variabile]|uniref:hypothetical protein n=1 Tax=Corynebacterium variabile TaxID=1727 RepID=UPI003F930ED0